MTNAEAQYKEEAMQMTIKEAIDYLQPIADNSDVPKHVEALRVALDAMREVEVLREELKEERYRHDRYVDYSVDRDRLIDELKAEQWISVTDRMPPDLTDILAYYDSGEIDIDCRFTKRGFIGEETYGEVTHWMPLPEPPVIDKE